jgi:arylsulfatase A-like enzyme
MPDGKPNILVIWGDDIGITNLSCYSDGREIGLDRRQHQERLGQRLQ